jgi:pyruvate/2-oxoglutarate dehydrogenase complex dihydrolipoamide dehydrogenase (E3) component
MTSATPFRVASREATHDRDPERLIRPLDEWNRRHLSHVRPSAHRNPTPRERYHLVVIGAGPGGLVTAAAAAALGAKVALIERHLMGGDCLNVGCVPSKATLRAARGWHDARTGSTLFGAPDASGDGNFAAAMQRMRRLRSSLSHVDSVERFQTLGVDVFLGEGQFVAPDEVEVDGARLRFRRAVIATGTRPAIPDVPGLVEADPLTNETLFWLEELPPRLVVIGAGPIGCEMAQAFARFGSQLTVLGRRAGILPRDDRDAAQMVQGAMERDGVTFRLGSTLLSVDRRGDERLVYHQHEGRRQPIVADQILVAAGRRPNVEALQLERAGVAHDGRGVAVDDRLRTSNRRVYAIGDVCSRHQFTHVADAHARLVVANALFFGRGCASRLVVPWCTYTSPEVAHVGMSADESMAAARDVESLTFSLADLDRAVLEDATEGFVRVHLARGTDRILGATVVANHAGDMIGELALAITARVGLSKIGATIHPYPTLGEAIRKVADAWRRTKLTPTVKRVFDLYFRIAR